MADDIEEKTGIRPNPFDLDVAVDVYNMCGFTRYFYMARTYANLIPTRWRSPGTTPFRIENKTSTSPGNLTMRTLDSSGMQQVMINHDNIMHIVGFVENGKGGALTHKQLMSYAKIGEIPHIKISEKEKITISTDLANLKMKHMDIILCMAGVLYVFNLNDEILKYLENKVFVYHENCFFNKQYINGIYNQECNAVILMDKKDDSLTLPSGSVLGQDYIMIPLNVDYYSPTETGYILLESKSFGTRRELHMAKRFAIDCIENYLRTFNPASVDGSLDCDYEECRYTCSSAVLTDGNTRSLDSNLYLNDEGEIDDDKVYWSNYEILYSDKLVKECREKIIKLFVNKNEIKIADIYKKFLEEYKREYFINMAIYTLAIGRYKVIDSFGYNCYITKGKYSLFLTRDFPELINNNNVKQSGKYTQKLIGVTSNPDYRNLLNVDDHIIEEIERLNIHQDISQKDLNTVISHIVSKISEFKMYNSIILIERCLGRIAYNKIVSPEFRNPEFAEKSIDQIVCGDIFPIRCFSSQKPDGSLMFFHNQPDILETRKQGEISKIQKASNPFRMFYIQDGKPSWRNVSKVEQKDLQKIAIANIRKIINDSVTLNINGEIFVSKYHVSYYNGDVRFVNEVEGPGEMFSSLKPNKIQSFISWVVTTPLMKIPGNYERIAKIYSLLDSSKKDEKIKKVERIKDIIDFFKVNKLIVKYSVMPDDNIVYNIDNDYEDATPQLTSDFQNMSISQPSDQITTQYQQQYDPSQGQYIQQPQYTYPQVTQQLTVSYSAPQPVQYGGQFAPPSGQFVMQPQGAVVQTPQYYQQHFTSNIQPNV